MSLNETIVEDAALSWFGEMAYAVGHGPKLAPGEPAAERESFGEVVLVGRLREDIARLTPTIADRIRKAMPTNPELTSARNLAYQGTGRNLLQFQRLEHLLKGLLGCHQGSYTIETIVPEMERHQKAQEKKTLGMLAGGLFESVILKQPSGDVLPADDADSGTVSHRFFITITEEMHQDWQCRLKGLVEERNELVHLSLLSWDLDTIEGCQAVVTALDEQLGRILKQIEQVKSYHEWFTQGMQQLWGKLTDTDVVQGPGAAS